MRLSVSVPVILAFFTKSSMVRILLQNQNIQGYAKMFPEIYTIYVIDKKFLNLYKSRVDFVKYSFVNRQVSCEHHLK